MAKHLSILHYKDGSTRDIYTDDHLAFCMSNCSVADIDLVFWILFDVVKIEYKGVIE